MSEGGRLGTENETLDGRPSGLIEAILRISEDLELDNVLQEVADSARMLTGARYAALVTHDEEDEPQDLMISGLTERQTERVMAYPLGMEVLRYFGGLQRPLRTRDFMAHIEAAGFADFPLQIGAFVSMRVGARDKHVGNLFIGEKESGADFTLEDEETLRMFAAQAALAIANARRYGEEQRAKADLEALLNASSVGVLVFDALTRAVVKINRKRAVLSVTNPGRRVTPPVPSEWSSSGAWTGRSCRPTRSRSNGPYTPARPSAPRSWWSSVHPATR